MSVIKAHDRMKIHDANLFTVTQRDSHLGKTLRHLRVLSLQRFNRKQSCAEILSKR